MKLIDIHSPQDIKPLTIDDLKDLAKQMRAAIINYTSTIGGHVGPNLGDVEALIGVHYVFDAPKDKIVIDVSHQDFVHKMLTGRAQYYLDKSKFTEIGEFTDPNESPEYDIFYAGHTSPSISLAFGLAKARSLKKEDFNIVAFIGDGSLSGGVAFEGLNNAGKLNDNFIVIVNDNQMAIAENHGSLYDNLRELRETNGQSEHNYFKSLGYDYIYVAEGNDLESVINALKKAKDTKNPIVVHLNTQKGEGYAPAEAHREEFHFSHRMTSLTVNLCSSQMSRITSPTRAIIYSERLKKIRNCSSFLPQHLKSSASWKRKEKLAATSTLTLQLPNRPVFPQ